MTIEEKCRRRIVELNHPECASYKEAVKKDLYIGCDILIPQNGGGMYSYKVVHTMGSNCYLDVQKTWKGNKNWGEVEPIILARNCAITNDTLERYRVRDVTILGLPCTIGRVMKAIENAHEFIEFRVGNDSSNLIVRDYSEEGGYIIEWQLTKENGQECELSDQTEETISKLLDLVRAIRTT